MELKVCGMKYEENILEVAELRPDFMGFIFYPGSKRYFAGEIPELPPSIRKIGVFVNEDLEQVLETISKHDLAGVQLHGEEDPGYCRALMEAVDEPEDFFLVKVFRLKDSIDFDSLLPYEGLCSCFLFDTLGEQRGGTGEKFNWEVLKGYPHSTPYLLSGGIGPDDLESLERFLGSEFAASCLGVDVNSRFEESPGLKNTEQLKIFVNEFKAIKR